MSVSPQVSRNGVLAREKGFEAGMVIEPTVRAKVTG